MDFNYLSDHLNKVIEVPLPGIKAHKTLSPLNRSLFSKHDIPVNAKKAGVLVLIYPCKNNEANIILTKRAKYKGLHSHQISFPGGKKNNDDINLKQTAIRETFEEVGLSEKHINTHKQLTSIYIPISNFQVNPYLATSSNFPVFTKNYEVEEIIHLSIKELLNDKNLSSFKMPNLNTKETQTPCFFFEDHCVWGATAMILNEVKEILKKL